MIIALKVKNDFKSTILAIDFLKRESNNEYLVIEASFFNDVDTPEQLVVNGTPGFMK
jgi:hypothetical protein